MTTSESHRLTMPLSGYREWTKAALLLLIFAPALLLAADYRPVVAVAYFALLGGLGMLAYPRLVFYLFLVSIAVYLPFPISNTVALHPFDVILLLLFGISIFEFLLRGSTAIRPTGLDLPFIALILATVVSALFAHNPSYSIVPVFRICVMYIAFRMIFKFAVEIGVRRVILFYIYLVLIHSLYNAVVFLMQGGQERVFGPAWLAYETFAMTALPMTFAFLVWSPSLTKRLWFSLAGIVIGVGMLAGGSRGPMLAVVITIPLLLFFGWRKATRERSISSLRVMRGLLLPLLAIIGLVIALRGTLFLGVIERLQSLIESIGDPQETVLLRLVLYKAAIKAFLSNPLSGIGIGNFKIVDEVVPEMRMEPVWFYIRGMSAHNVVLHYLAETGLFGTIALLATAVTGLRMAYRAFRQQLADHQNQVSAALFVSMLVFCLTLLYMRAWTWGQGGYIMALLFGLTAAWNYERQNAR